MKLIYLLPTAAQLARFPYAGEQSTSTYTTHSPTDALEVLGSALAKLLPHSPSTSWTTVTPRETIKTTTFLTVDLEGNPIKPLPTVTITTTVAAQFARFASAGEQSTSSHTHSPTDAPEVLKAAPAIHSPTNALEVLNEALATFQQTSTFSLETSTALKKRHYSSLTWSNTTSPLSNSTSETDPIVPATPAVGLPFTSEFGYGSNRFTDVSPAMSSEGDFTTTLIVTDMTTITEKTTVTEVPTCAATISPQNSDVVQPISSATTMQVDTVTIPGIPTPAGNEPNESLTATAAAPTDASATTSGLEVTAIAAGVSTSTVWTTTVFVTTTESTSTVTTEQSAQPVEPTNPVVSIQTTMPTAGVEPVNTPSVSLPLEITTSHISYGHPPSLTRYHNSTASTISTSCTESVAHKNLGTGSVKGFAETIPPPPKVPIDATQTGIWGRPTSLATSPSSKDHTPEAAHQKLGTGSVNSLVETIPPPPNVPIDGTQTGIWGRPPHLSIPPSFEHHTPEAAHQKLGTGAEAYPDPTASLDQTHTGISHNHTSTRTHHHEDHPASSAVTTPVAHTSGPTNTTSHSTTKRPVETHCTTTFHRTPTQACTETHYATTTTFGVNCYGCVGEHALPSSACNKGSVCQSSVTVTVAASTISMCELFEASRGSPEATTVASVNAATASSGFVTSVSSALAGYSQWQLDWGWG